MLVYGWHINQSLEVILQAKCVCVCVCVCVCACVCVVYVCACVHVPAHRVKMLNTWMKQMHNNQSNRLYSFPICIIDSIHVPSDTVVYTTYDIWHLLSIFLMGVALATKHIVNAYLRHKGDAVLAFCFTGEIICTLIRSKTEYFSYKGEGQVHSIL